MGVAGQKGDATMPDGLQAAGRADDLLLTVLAQLLTLQAADIRDALAQAADVVARALEADKVDAFLHLPADDLLVAIGVSDTPMGRLQRALGLDRLPAGDAGIVGLVFADDAPFLTGQLEREPRELPGVVRDLGGRSLIAVPLRVGPSRRGVLQAISARVEQFGEPDLRFLQAVAGWVGLIGQRADLAEHLATAMAPHERGDRAPGWEERLAAWRLGELETIARESQAALAEYEARSARLTAMAADLQEALRRAEDHLRYLEGR